MGQFLFVRGCSELVVLRDLSCLDCAPSSIATDNTKIEIYGAIEVDNYVNIDLSIFNLTECRTCRVLQQGTYSDGAALMLYGYHNENGPAVNYGTDLVEFGNIVNGYGRTCLFTAGGRSILTSYCNFYSNQMEVYLFWCYEGLIQCDFCYFFGNVIDSQDKRLFAVETKKTASITVRNCYFDGSLPSGNFYDSNSPCFGNAVFTSFPIYHYYTAYCSGIPRRTTHPFTHSFLFPASFGVSSSVDFAPTSLITNSIPSIFGIQGSFVRFGLFCWHISFTAGEF
jgi:hypothetical protein